MRFPLFLSAQTHGIARILRVPVKNGSERLNLQSHFLYPFPIFQLASLLPVLQFYPGIHYCDEPLLKIKFKEKNGWSPEIIVLYRGYITAK